MDLNERNYAGDHVVVGSLEVLGSIKGNGVTEIRRNVALVQQQAEQIAKKQNIYWETLSDDGVISPIEKQMLLKEVKSIQNSYAAIYAQAVSLDLDATRLFLDYKAVYEDLYSYLYNNLKLFDDMTVATDINDREAFNSYFSQYYYDESFILLALSKGILATIDIRVLENLNEEGDEGEVAIYKGGLYQYTDGQWENVLTGFYKGALEKAPDVKREGDFFLSSKDYIEALYINGKPLYINGDLFGIKLYQKGWIYYWEDGRWRTDWNRNSHRYYEAMTDVIFVTGELPEIFQIQMTRSNPGNIYQGRLEVPPVDPIEGMWFVYSGSTTGRWHKSSVYRRTNGEWEELSPTQSQYRQYYMTALEDILYLNEASDSYFAAIFAQSLFANDATIGSLSTKTIYLREGGYIQSDVEQYIPNTRGLLIDGEGNIDANGDTHIGGTCIIDGDSVISGNAMFRGDIIAGPLTLLSSAPSGEVTTFLEGEEIPLSVVNVTGTYKGYSFNAFSVANSTYTYSYGHTETIDGRTYYYDVYYNYNVVLKLFDSDNNLVKTFTQTRQFYRQSLASYAYGDDLYNPVKYKAESIFTYTKNISEHTKTFKLSDLPDQMPGESDIVYVDENGFLKLS